MDNINLEVCLFQKLKDNREDWKLFLKSIKPFEYSLSKKYQDLVIILNKNNINIIRINLVGSKIYSWNFKIFNIFIYKTILCYHHFNLGNCHYKSTCPMAHSLKEIKIKFSNLKFSVNYFKSELCPMIKFKHNNISCVFSHGLFDYKRPYLKYLNNSMCQNLISYFKKNYQNKKILNNITFDIVCKNYLSCNFWHSRIEYLFHPKNFQKLKICNKKNKHVFYLCKKLHCNDLKQIHSFKKA